MMKMTDRQFDVLNEMTYKPEEWKRTMDLGGRDASWHSAAINQCVKKGWAERKRRRYRITEAGKAALRARDER